MLTNFKTVMPSRDFSAPLIQAEDTDFDVLSKINLSNGPYRPKVLASGVSHTGLNLLGVYFYGDATVASATATGAEGNLAGTYPAGSFLPYNITAIQVTSTGPIHGLLASAT